MRTHCQVNGTRRAGSGCYDLCNTFVYQAHTKRNNDGGELGGNEYQRVNEAQYHAEQDAEDEELEDVFNGVNTGNDQGCEQTSKNTGSTKGEVHSARVEVGIECECRDQGHQNGSAHDHNIAKVIKRVTDDKQTNAVGS